MSLRYDQQGWCHSLLFHPTGFGIFFEFYKWWLNRRKDTERHMEGQEYHQPCGAVPCWRRAVALWQNSPFVEWQAMGGTCKSWKQTTSTNNFNGCLWVSISILQVFLSWNNYINALATPGCAAPRHVEGRWDQSIHLGIGFNDRKKHLEVGKATM